MITLLMAVDGDAFFLGRFQRGISGSERGAMEMSRCHQRINKSPYTKQYECGKPNYHQSLPFGNGENPRITIEDTFIPWRFVWGLP